MTIQVSQDAKQLIKEKFNGEIMIQCVPQGGWCSITFIPTVRGGSPTTKMERYITKQHEDITIFLDKRIREKEPAVPIEIHKKGLVFKSLEVKNAAIM